MKIRTLPKSIQLLLAVSLLGGLLMQSGCKKEDDLIAGGQIFHRNPDYSFRVDQAILYRKDIGDYDTYTWRNTPRWDSYDLYLVSNGFRISFNDPNEVPSIEGAGELLLSRELRTYEWPGVVCNNDPLYRELIDAPDSTYAILHARPDERGVPIGSWQGTFDFYFPRDSLNGQMSIELNNNIKSNSQRELKTGSGSYGRSAYCEDDLGWSIEVSSLRADWYDVEVNMTLRNGGSLSGIYTGPIVVLDLAGCEKWGGDCDSLLTPPNDTTATEQVTTLAGVRDAGFIDGNPGAMSYGALDILLHPFPGVEDIFVCDLGNSVIRQYDGSGLSTLAGTGLAGYQDGTTQDALFNRPNAIAGQFIEFTYTLYIADQNGGSYLRTVDNFGQVETRNLVDENGNTVRPEYLGIEAITVGPNGRLYVINNAYAGPFQNKICEIELLSGGAADTMRVYAGAGISPQPEVVINGPALSAYFNFPKDLVFDPVGNLYVADAHSIRKISTDLQVTTLAGQDESGNFLGLPADYYTNHVVPGGTRIFEGFSSIDYDDFRDRIVATHIGNEIWAFWEENGDQRALLINQAEFGLEDGSLSDALFQRPNAIQVDDHDGTLYVADGATIRRIQLP